nr:WS/DGAT domain-containing protein [Oleomonas cavernae]
MGHRHEGGPPKSQAGQQAARDSGAGAGPGRALPSVARAAAQVVRAAVRSNDAHSPAPYRAPRSLLNGRIGGQRRYATQYFKLDALRQIAKAADATVNEVFLTACGGALRRYLRENNALPPRTLVAQVPVNLRDEAGIDTIGNAIGFIYVNIHTDIADTAARLAAVRKSGTLAKQQYAGIRREGINLFTMLLLAPYMLQTFLGLGGRLPAAANLVISNVAGPREHRYLNGARINQMFGPSVIFDGQALNITLMSYADEANIGFTGCRTTLPRMQNIAVYLGEELRALQESFDLEA